MNEPANNARRTGPALEAMYQFMLWLIPTIDKFPRSQKFVLGDRIEAAALDVLDALIAATYTRGRDTMLANANLGLERLRFARNGTSRAVGRHHPSAAVANLRYLANGTPLRST
nr:hypothetical protein [uncultured Rhodopila sp.]